MTTEQALCLADDEIEAILNRASARATARCLAQQAQGKKADYDTTLADELARTGMPPAGAAVYQKHRPVPTRREIDLQLRSAAAREECEAIRARGGKPDTDGIPPALWVKK